MAIIDAPATRGPVDEVQNGVAISVTRGFAAFFGQVYAVCFAASQSGTTAQRPTSGLYPGRPYFDTSLGANGMKIWVSKTGSTWVDGAGNVV